MAVEKNDEELYIRKDPCNLLVSNFDTKCRRFHMLADITSSGHSGSDFSACSQLTLKCSASGIVLHRAPNLFVKTLISLEVIVPP